MENAYNHTAEVHKELDSVNKFIQEKIQGSTLETQEELLAFAHGIASTWLSIGSKLSQDRRAFIEDVRKEAYELVLGGDPNAFSPTTIKTYIDTRAGEDSRISKDTVKVVNEKVDRIFKVIGRELSDMPEHFLNKDAFVFMCTSGMMENVIDNAVNKKFVFDLYEELFTMMKEKYHGSDKSSA